MMTLTAQAGEACIGLVMPQELVEPIREDLSPFVDVLPPISGSTTYWTIALCPLEELQYPRMPVNPHDDDVLLFHVDASSRTAWLAADLDTCHLVARYIRMTLRALLSSKGSIFLHAGMASVDGVGIVVSGGKRRGKTSALLEMLSVGGTLVSNDDLSLESSKRGHIVGRGWPRRISIRPDVWEIDWPVRHTPVVDLLVRDSRLVKPQELASAFSSSCQASERVRAMVFPRFVEDTGVQTLTRLTIDEAFSAYLREGKGRPVEKTNRVPFAYEAVEPSRSFSLWSDSAGVRYYELVRPFSAVGQDLSWIDAVLSNKEDC